MRIIHVHRIGALYGERVEVLVAESAIADDIEEGIV